MFKHQVNSKGDILVCGHLQRVRNNMCCMLLVALLVYEYVFLQKQQCDNSYDCCFQLKYPLARFPVVTQVKYVVQFPKLSGVVNEILMFNSWSLSSLQLWQFLMERKYRYFIAFTTCNKQSKMVSVQLGKKTNTTSKRRKGGFVQKTMLSDSMRYCITYQLLFALNSIFVVIVN